MNLNDNPIFNRLTELLQPLNLPIFWRGSPLPEPEPTAFLVLESGFNTPSYHWGHAINTKTVRIRVVAIPLGLRNSLVNDVAALLPASEFRVNNTLSTDDQVDGRFEAVLNINIIT